MKSYRDFIVWQKSVNMVIDVYKLLNSFPDDEKFGLTSQIKRSSVSISSNKAEGYGRNYTKDNIRFLNITRGSLYETQTQLQIAINRGHADKLLGLKLYEIIRIEFKIAEHNKNKDNENIVSSDKSENISYIKDSYLQYNRIDPNKRFDNFLITFFIFN